MPAFRLALVFLLVPATCSAFEKPKPPPTRAESLKEYGTVVKSFLQKHCAVCHGEKKQEGDLSFAKLSPDMKASTSASRWAVVLQKLNDREMPPPERPQPKAAEREGVVAWIKAEMKRAGKHVAFRREYRDGNKIPHHLLFDPKTTAAFDAKPQLRRHSPEIYARFNSELGKGARGVNQPFTPSDDTTFKDMGAPKLDEPTTATLIRNSLAMVAKLTDGRVPKEIKPLLDEKREPTDEELKTAIEKQFANVLRRKPTEKELARFVALMRKNMKDGGRKVGVKYTLAAVFLMPEAIYRWEIGMGAVDKLGRQRLSPRSIAFAVSYALTDQRAPDWLLKMADKGDLDTKEGVAKAVRKILADRKMNKVRIMRFFREYFGYGKAVEVFKDQKKNNAHDARALVADTDRLVELILKDDKNVLYELLTTNKAFVFHTKAAEIKKRRIADRKKFEDNKRKNPKKYKNKRFKPFGRSVYEAYNLPDFPDQQPVELPAKERAGILTQPAWLVAMSTSDDNHAIFRGKWVRERLLGNVVPDLPITVDAQLPNAPHKTLRDRMKVTQETYCWKCHRLMNPVGLPFESYDHLGRFRKTETVLDPVATEKNVDKKGKPRGPVFRETQLDTSGRIDLTGDDRLKTDVPDAVEMLRKLAKSERVEQVFVRHAFRFFLGRSETLGDAKSLQEVHGIYRKSGGSMKELMIGLLTSDSFLYRKAPAPASGKK